MKEVSKKGRAIRAIRAMRIIKARRKIRVIRKTPSNISLSTIDCNQHYAKPYNIPNITWLNRFGAPSGLLVGYRAQICNQPDHLQHCQKAPITHPIFVSSDRLHAYQATYREASEIVSPTAGKL